VTPGTASKAKGSAYERELARSMSAKRRPLSGASGGGDIAPEPGTIWAHWSWEAKRRTSRWVIHASPPC